MTELTVCMNVYNGEEFLDRSIGSVGSQTLQDFRVLVYDDGSTNGTVQKLRSFHDDRMRIVEGGENRGVLYSRAMMIPMIDTEYCMWLDDDDCFCRDDALERALSLAKAGDYDVVSFENMNIAHADGGVRTLRRASTDRAFIDGNFLGGLDGYYCQQLVSKIFKSELLKKCVPEKEVYGRRFVADEQFFLVPMAFHLRRYFMSSENPIYMYYNDIGVWGSKKDDRSLDRMRGLCEYTYNLALSCYRRISEARPMTALEKKTLVRMCGVEGLCFTMKNVAEEDRGKAFELWREYFGKDGMHLLNGVDDFIMPVHLKYLEGVIVGEG